MRILIPFDGSPLSEHAVGVANEFAQAMNAEIILFAVAELAETSTHAEQVEQDHHAQFDRAAAELPGISVERRIDTGGAPAEGILKAIDELDVDHIVMTTHGRSGLSRLAQGSVAEEVLRHARVPVTLVRPIAEGG